MSLSSRFLNTKPSIRREINQTTTFIFVALFAIASFFLGCDSTSDDTTSSPNQNGDGSVDISGSGGNAGASGEAGSSGEAGNDGDAGTNGAAGSSGSTPNTSMPTVGQFEVVLVPPNAATNTVGSTAVRGGVYESKPILDPVIWELQDEVGECQLLTPRVPFCDPPCGSAVCIEDDQCEPSPSRVDVGTVTVQGLSDSSGPIEITIDAIAGGKYTMAETLPYPAFDEGGAIQIDASGGDTEPFSIQSLGISPLSLTAQGEIPIEKDSPMLIEWTAPTQPDISRIQALVDISHHGGAKGKILCEAADTGSLTIDASLITQLIDLGYSGFPKIVVTRVAMGATDVELGRVELTVESTDERGLTIPGLTSCQIDTDCPEGQTCQQDFQCK